MTRARIIGVGAYAPKRVLTNADLEKLVDTSDEWIVQRTGIRERRIADDSEATSDLAVKAAQQALERANLDIVQHRLGCRRAGSVDLMAACAGSVYSLVTGAQFIQTGKYKRVLCIGAETLSKITDFTDRGTCILLADAAGAVVLEATEEDRGIIDVDLYSDGQYWELLYMPGGGSRHPATAETVAQRMHYAKMKGNEVFKVAVRMFVECAEKILSRNGFTAADVSLFIPHQANLRIIEAAAKRVNLPMERVFVNVDRYGNTGAASVYVALKLMAAFGGGFAWGAVLMRW
ncbi:MAG: ketoacyl-ACP synthase III [Chloroflexi bacterium]|nr:MAG: ketoacyl-ACP synthase III [Chloroflexota bacterium]